MWNFPKTENLINSVVNGQNIKTITTLYSRNSVYAPRDLKGGLSVPFKEEKVKSNFGRVFFHEPIRISTVCENHIRSAVTHKSCYFNIKE